MDKRRAMFLLVFLVLLLGVVNATWIIYYKKTITAEVTGDAKSYYISQNFDGSISLNTSNGPVSKSTLLKIEDVQEDTNMLFKIETRDYNLNSSCLDSSKDCRAVVTQIFSNGTRKILSDTDYYDVNKQANFTLFKDVDSSIEYNLSCVEDSCPQRINSTITIEQVPNSP